MVAHQKADHFIGLLRQPDELEQALEMLRINQRGIANVAQNENTGAVFGLTKFLDKKAAGRIEIPASGRGLLGLVSQMPVCGKDIKHF